MEVMLVIDELIQIICSLVQLVLLIAVAAPGLAEGFDLARSPYSQLWHYPALIDYPATLGATPVYSSPGLPSKGFYMLKESASPAGLRRMKRTPIDPATAIGLASLGATIGGVGYSSRGSWNPASTQFWEARGKTECSSNPFSRAYCGRSNPASCSSNPFSRRYCGNN